MTKLELQNSIEQDPLSLVNFVVANNPTDLIISLHVAGYKSVETESQAKDVLVALIQQNKKDEFLQILKGVPYINNAPNETAGFKEYFLSKLSPEDRMRYQQDMNSRPFVRTSDVTIAEEDTKSTWLNIGSGVVGIVGSIFGSKAAVSNATYLDAQARATQQKVILVVALTIAAIILIAGFAFAFKQAKK